MRALLSRRWLLTSTGKESKMKRIIAALLVCLLSAAAAEALDGWQHLLKKDPMDDTIRCIVCPSPLVPPGAAFFFSSASLPAAGVVGDKYPAREIKFRVDKNMAIVSTDEFLSGGQLKKLMSQIQSNGEILLVEFIEWPSGVPVVLKYPLKGIKESFKACESIIWKQGD